MRVRTLADEEPHGAGSVVSHHDRLEHEALCLMHGHERGRRPGIQVARRRAVRGGMTAGATSDQNGGEAPRQHGREAS